MAHGHYNCCAVCDTKMEYAWDARTKEKICLDCLVALRSYGCNVLTAPELVEYVKGLPEALRGEFLARLGYRKCYYSNRVDAAIIPLITEKCNEEKRKP